MLMLTAGQLHMLFFIPASLCMIYTRLYFTPLYATLHYPVCINITTTPHSITTDCSLGQIIGRIARDLR